MCNLYLFFNTVFAQQLNFSRFTSKDGLAQNHCRTITTDSLGYLWIGTLEGGVSRYDGHEFVNYNKKNDLSSNFIFQIESDKHNNVWLATENGIISIHGKKIKNYLAGDTVNLKIHTLMPDLENRIWFAHPDKGPGYIKDKEVFYPEIEFAGDKHIIHIFCDSQNRIWFCTERNGLFVYDHHQVKEVPLLHSRLRQEIVISFHENKDGTFLLGSSNGLYKLNRDLDRVIEWHPELSNKIVTSIYEDSKNRIWYGTLHGAYVQKNDTTLNFISKRNGLTDFVYDITEDFEGGIWFSTFRGVYRLNNFFFESFSTSDGLNDNLVWAVKPLDNNTLWVGTESGLNLIENNQIVNIPGIPKDLSFWASPIISDGEGNTLFGSESSVYSYNGKKFKKYPKENAIFKEYYTSAIKRANGDIIFAGNNGISKLEDGKFEQLLASSVFQNYQINSVTEDHLKRLWVGTEGGGVFIWTPEETKRLYTGNKYLSNDVINVVYTDSKHNIWVGTSGNGLFKFHEAIDNQKPVSFEDLDLSSTNIYSIIEDDEGNIWAGTDQGLNKLYILQNDYIKVKTYGEREGFFPMEVCHNAINKDTEGNLWYGTVEGVMKINPHDDAFTNELPRIQLTDIQLFFKDVQWEEYNENLDEYTGLPLNQQLELSSEDNHLLFFFTGIGYTIPSKIKYQWRLEGLEKDWHPPSNNTEAIYPNIPPGKYTLEIKAINAAGLSSEESYSFTFSVTKPFYQTRAFMLISVILSITLAYFYYASRVNNLKRYQQRLESKVKQRTKEIEEQNEKIRAQSKRLTIALEEIDQKNQELVKAQMSQKNSLAYARKIQKAFMFSENKLKECLPNSLVFFQTKELVSSDFYWINEYEEHIFVVLVDCTGHGVPGAFLSMIGFEYLTEIIEMQQIHDPATILKELNNKIRLALHHSEGKELVDGMDVAVCRINKKVNTLTFSGARRPLHYVQGNELHVIKGHFSGAGINLQEDEPVFENVHICLHPDTKLFLFSDGYPNQFNKKGQKFKITRFKKLLLDISKLDCEKEQHKQLKESLDNWIEDVEQLDDVMVLGFNYYNDKIPEKKGAQTTKTTDNQL